MKLLTKFDKYIINKFFWTFTVAILLTIAIIVVFDFTDKLPKFIENNLKSGQIAKYYLSVVPYYLNLFMPLFIFLAIIFFTSKMAGKSEIIAALSSGVSFFRLLLPYFYTTFIFAMLSFYLANFVIPHTNKKRIEFESKYIYYRPPSETRNIHKQIQPGVFLYIKYFDIVNNVGHNVTIEKFENNVLVSKLSADNIFWDANKQKWRANNYIIRHIKKYQDDFEKGAMIDTNLYITPQDIKETKVNIETLNMPELNKFIADQKLHGNEHINDFLIEKYQRTAIPFSTFILMFIAVAMSSKKKRGGTGLNIGIGLVLSLFYILLQKISNGWATSGAFSPLVAVWLPNIIYTFIAAALYPLAPK